MGGPVPDSPSSKSGSDVSVWIRQVMPVFLWTLAIVLILRFFNAFTVVALGLLTASIFAAALRPLRRVFPGPRWWSAALAAILPTIVFVLLMVLMFWVLADPIKREAARLPEIGEQIDGQLAYWSERLGLREPLKLRGIAIQLGGYMGEGVLSTTAGVVTHGLLAAVFIFFGSLFLLGEKPGRLIEPIIIMLSPQRGRQLKEALHDLDPQFRWWLLGSLISMTVTGVATWIGYSLIGLQYAGPLALIAGLAEIVPTFGPLLAFLIALLFAAAQGGTSIVGIIIAYVFIQGLESYVLQPFVMKQAVHMPPVVTLFTIILWSTIFGPAGLILAIPINLVIWACLEHLVLRPRRERMMHGSTGSAEP
jgi:predicted PurR-regulated permease PerM